jgi:hypothetical protein
MRVAAQTVEFNNIQFNPTTIKQKLHWFVLFRPTICIEKNNLYIIFKSTRIFEEYAILMASTKLNNEIKLALKKNKNSVFNNYILFDIHHYMFFSVVKMNYQIK